MSFATLDTATIARALAGISAGDDLVDAFFERALEWELPPAGARHGFRRRADSGLAVRLARGGRQWLASRDALDGAAFAEALRQAARASPYAAVEPEIPVDATRDAEDEAAAFAELAEFPGELERALRALHTGFPLRVTARRVRREVLCVTARLAGEPQQESFASAVAETPWGRTGELFARLDRAAAERFAARLVDRFRARAAAAPAAGRARLLLAPEATAVLLHEAVAHALEADLLLASGRAEAAIGLELGARALSVLDDPARAPEGVARTSDDEGMPVVRRWLLREGRVEQPLADALAARLSEGLLAGSGFRGDRHSPPLPRSVHLELVPGEASEASLLSGASGGFLVREIESGALDPVSGEVSLEIPAARRIEKGAPGEPCGRFRARGRVADLLSRVVAVGAAAERCGAGWCAKAAQRRAVWATAPAMLVEGVEIAP